MFNNHRVVVTMTSWTKRISNCVKVIQSILDNTMKPDLVFLNLSLEEFPNRNKDLPQDLVEMSLKNPKVKINWVDGPNTKTMKKVFPILKYLEDEDVIIYTDDDVVFPKVLIESRISDFLNISRPVTGRKFKTYNQTLHDVFGVEEQSSTVLSLVQKKMLNGYETLIECDDVVKTYNDDMLYTLLVIINGYHFACCSDYATWVEHGVESNNTIKFFQQISPLSSSNGKNTHKNSSVRLCQIVKGMLDKNGVGDMNQNNERPKIAVYTYCTNNFAKRRYQSVKFTDINIDYYMFVDDKTPLERTRNGWTLVQVSNKTECNYVEDLNKYYKWHPTVVPNFDKYDYVLYVDSKVEILENPNVIIESVKNKIPLGMCCHIYNYRAPILKDNYKCLYKHMDYLIQFPAGNVSKLKKWKELMLNIGLPNNVQIGETAVLITDTHNENALALGDKIFKTYLASGTLRDQVVLPVVLRLNGYALKDFYTLGNYLTYSDEIGTKFFRNDMSSNITRRNKR